MKLRSPVFRRTLFLLAVFFSAAPRLAAQAVPFRNLTPQEDAAILRGESVFRQPKVWAEICAQESSPFYKELREGMRKLNPNYIGEVIMLVPRAASPDLLRRLVRDLADVESHVGIPYWSARYKKTFDLFDSARIVERNGTETEGSLTADLHMKPFDDYRSRYEWSLRGERLSFRSTNLTHLSYDGRKSVSPGNMVWRLEAYPDGDSWVLYGIGAVKAFDMFGLMRDRLSASFMGRIQAFFENMYGKGIEL